VLCRQLQPALGKGQSTEVNPGQRLCWELGRGSRHRSHLCRRPDGRAVSTVDGSPNVTTLASSPAVHSIMPRVPACRCVVSIIVPSAALGKDFLYRWPHKKPSAKF
jgi:hypothetical protein